MPRSSTARLPWFDGTVLEGAQITFDAVNLTNDKQFAYVGNPNAVVFAYYPGPSYMIGFRGKF
jgi:outer membrane receptor protein involved in Fe transport